MANTNPARGMRDFLPEQVRKREYVIGIIKEVYEKYGFEPLETPAVENLSTLTNKYGQDGDQLMFKILKRGEKLQQELEAGNIKSENELSDLALRYDLTVPLARVVANYKNDLPRFFKRYQIQPVWRADRPARGRFREFYQCDADSIGSKSMIVEAELCSAVSEIFERLGLEDFEIKINHRGILQGLLENAAIPSEKQAHALGILDKLDKIGDEAVRREFAENGISGGPDMLDIILSVGADEDWRKLEVIKIALGDHQNGRRGVSEVVKIIDFCKQTPIKFEPTLARGLSYYTGAIFEVVLNRGDFDGSIAGGGRYDGLIGVFGKEDIPAVGFSLGLERILLIMEERGIFPATLATNTADVLVTVWNEETIAESLKLAGELRQKGLRVLVYPEADKLGKQFKYADQTGVQFVCILGETELAENTVSLKNMKTGDQDKLTRSELWQRIMPPTSNV